MNKKLPAPLPPAALAEDLLDTPIRPCRQEITWLRRPARPRPPRQDDAGPDTEPV